MARKPKTLPAGTDPVQVNPAAHEQTGTAGEAAVAQAVDLPGNIVAPGAPQVIPRGTEAVMLTITGPKHGRRRIGRQFGTEPVVIAAADLTEAERSALAADPLLKIDVSAS
ncbi:MAG: hypothetical protein CVT86_07130 [Alphaproteobacteria bacterium HGW-Alphaproteobacteria-8]|jgi:hypothetical protein|nr:MAG: hypothetical protein CVT86_07130 [Alphaproteobacteria bacterium HGW-Alphaproteobacteria-8]PKP71853.1 MAG: hypothetical protein CVT82_00340 [Alphaproteobacteria bacterium HGW-Alphaproteobacteria-4]